jgi:hypothetical protein
LRIAPIRFDVLGFGDHLKHGVCEMQHLGVNKHDLAMPDPLEQDDPPAARIEDLSNDLVAVHSTSGCPPRGTILQHATSAPYRRRPEAKL